MFNAQKFKKTESQIRQEKRSKRSVDNFKKTRSNYKSCSQTHYNVKTDNWFFSKKDEQPDFYQGTCLANKQPTAL